VVSGQIPRTKSSREQSIVEQLHDTFPDVRIAESRLLADYDSYYRDRERQAPLPVLRIRFEDPERTWVYVDLATSAPVAVFTRRQRIERWAYHGFHSLDFSFAYDNRPLWAIVVIVLCGGGMILSAIGVTMAFRRVSRIHTM